MYIFQLLVSNNCVKKNYNLSPFRLTHFPQKFLIAVLLSCQPLNNLEVFYLEHLYKYNASLAIRKLISFCLYYYLH